MFSLASARLTADFRKIIFIGLSAGPSVSFRVYPCFWRERKLPTFSKRSAPHMGRPNGKSGKKSRGTGDSLKRRWKRMAEIPRPSIHFPISRTRPHTGICGWKSKLPFSTSRIFAMPAWRCRMRLSSDGQGHSDGCPGSQRRHAGAGC